MFSRRDLGRSGNWSSDASMPSRENSQGVTAEVSAIIERAKRDPKFGQTELAKVLKTVSNGEAALKRMAPELDAKQQAVREAVRDYEIATQESERRRAEGLIRVEMQSLKAHENRYQEQERVVQANQLLAAKIKEALLEGRRG